MHIASIVIMKNRYKFVSLFNIQYFSLNFKIGQSGNLMLRIGIMKYERIRDTSIQKLDSSIQYYIGSSIQNYSYEVLKYIDFPQTGNVKIPVKVWVRDFRVSNFTLYDHTRPRQEEKEILNFR